MQLGASTGRALAAATVVAALALGACRTSSEDVSRWAATSQGPRKLVAVLTHEKYPLDLRVEAALALIEMKPRAGRRVGIQGSDDQIGLIAALAQLPPATRSALVSQLVPRLETAMKEPRPKPTGAEVPLDPAIPYKDAAFALLSHNGGALVTEPALRDRLRSAIIEFTTTNFAERLDDSSQLYGVEQVMRELKPDGVRPLPAMMTPGAAKIDRMAELVADFGDDATRLAASQRLVTIAKETDSNAWLKQKAPLVEAANKASKLTPPPDLFQKQLVQYQEEELLRVMTSMKRLGGKPVVEYLIAFAEDGTRKEKLRSAALVALQGKLDRSSTAHADAVLAIASAADTPDSLRDAALQRVAEFPREMVLSKLYGLFDHANWKVRWVAAGLILRMSDTSELEAFFHRLGKAEGMSISEPLRYGGLLASMKGPPAPAEAADKFARASYPAQVRTSALGYYYAVGTRADLPKVEAYARDRMRAPSCQKDSKECEWKCEVASGGSREAKDIATIGDFVTYCIKPVMEARPGGKT